MLEGSLAEPVHGAGLKYVAGDQGARANERRHRISYSIGLWPLDKILYSLGEDTACRFQEQCFHSLFFIVHWSGDFMNSK